MKIRTRTKMLSLAAAAATLLALSGCGAPASGQDAASSPAPALKALTVGVGGQLSNADVYLGISEGLFKKSGLEVSAKTLTAGSSAVPQLLQGSMQFAAMDLATAITATQQNVGVIAIAPNTVGNGADRAYAGVFARPESGIKKAADLVGKKVQVNQLGGTAEILIKATLEKEGVDPSKVQFVEIAPPQALASLQSGAVDAATLPEPLGTAAQGLGMTHVLNPEQKTVAEVPTFVFVTAKSYAAEHPDVVKAFSEAVLQANKLANANPDKVRETAKSNSSVDPEQLKKAVLPLFGEKNLTPDKIQEFIDLLVKYGGLDKNAAPKAENVIANTGQ